MRIGPGPDARLRRADDQRRQAADIAAYVLYLQQPDNRGGLPLGGFGPVTEGFVALLSVSAGWSPSACGSSGDGRQTARRRTDRTRRLLARTEQVGRRGVRCLAAGARSDCSSSYATGGQPQLEGLLLFVVLGGIGVGIVVWAKRTCRTAPLQRAEGTDRLDARGDSSRLRPRTSRRAGGHRPPGLPRQARRRGHRRPRHRRHLPDPLARSAPGRRPQGDAVAQGQPGRSTRPASRSWRSRAGRRRRRHRLPRGPRRRRRRPGPAHPPPSRHQRSPRRDARTRPPATSSPTRSSARTLGCPVGLYQAQAEPAAVPVPPVDVRRARRRAARVRPGDPAAAAAADRVDADGYLVATGRLHAARSAPASGIGTES